MSQQFYSDARLYDRLFPGGDQAVDFYRAEADRQSGCVSLGGLRVAERFGDWSRAPFTADAALQLYVCEPD